MSSPPTAREMRPSAAPISGPNTLLFGTSVVAFPIGTVLGIYVIYLLFCQKGRMIFSAPYKEVIKNTPQIKYGTSKAAWIVLLFLLLVFAIAVVWLGSR